MKKILLVTFTAISLPLFSLAQCTTSNAADCECLDNTEMDCDLLPDITCSWETGLNGHEEFAPGEGLQSGELNYADNWFGITPEIEAMGRIRVSVKTPNIGVGPLNIRGVDQDGYRWMICYDSGVPDTFSVYDPNWDEQTYCPDGSTPKHISFQRIYHKESDGTMSFWERMIGTMTYHPTHGHIHFDRWVEMTLRIPDENNMDNPLEWPIVGEGAKIGFCVMDLGSCGGGGCRDDETAYNQGTTLYEADFPNYGLGGGSYGCSPTSQGISSGYTDTYGAYLDGMFLNIPQGTCNGDYAVVMQVPTDFLVESNNDNNHAWFPVTLTQQTDPSNWTADITADGSTEGVCSNTGVTLSATYGTEYLWSTGETTQSIEVNASGDYSVTVIDDGCGVNGTSEVLSVNVVDVNVPVIEGPNSVGFNQSATLSSTNNNGEVSWYDQEEGGTAIATGEEFITPNLTAETTYYAANKIAGDEFDYELGEPNHTGSSQYGGDQYNSYLEFDVLQEIVLHDVTVYSEFPGTRKIQVTNASGEVVNELEVLIENAEEGQLVELNFVIPAGNDYRIGTEEATNLENFGTESPQLKRTNGVGGGNPGNVTFPYECPALSITNSTYDGYYYYFYDWNFTASSSCEARTPHTITVNSVGVEEASLVNSFNINPNPTNGLFNVYIQLEKASPIEVIIRNTLGQEVSRHIDNTSDLKQSFNLTSFPSGVYMVTVNVGESTYVEKVVYY